MQGCSPGPVKSGPSWSRSRTSAAPRGSRWTPCCASDTCPRSSAGSGSHGSRRSPARWPTSCSASTASSARRARSSRPARGRDAVGRESPHPGSELVRRIEPRPPATRGPGAARRPRHAPAIARRATASSRCWTATTPIRRCSRRSSGATRSVTLVSYIFDNDFAGHAFRDALVRAREPRRRGPRADRRRRLALHQPDDGGRAARRSGCRSRRSCRRACRASSSTPTCATTARSWSWTAALGFTGGMNIRAGHWLARAPEDPGALRALPRRRPRRRRHAGGFVADWAFTTGERLAGRALVRAGRGLWPGRGARRAGRPGRRHRQHAAAAARRAVGRQPHACGSSRRTSCPTTACCARCRWRRCAASRSTSCCRRAATCR